MIERTERMMQAALDAYEAGEMHSVGMMMAIDAVLAEVEQRYHLTEARHIATFNANGWTLQHPVRCRPNLAACVVNDAMRIVFVAPEQWGAYAVNEPDPSDWRTMSVGDRI